MSTVAELMIKLGMDDGGLDKGMSSSQSKLKSWGENLRSVGTKLTAGVTLPLVGAGIAAINWASDQEEASNKVGVVFGDNADAVRAWADSNKGSLLMSSGDAMEAAGTYGNLFTSMGMGQEQAAGLSTGLVELAQDLSSFNNVPTDTALVALRAALVGEYEPMRALGVQLSQATVEQKALEMGIWDGNGALTAQQRALATNELIMEQTTNAQGDAARTAKGFANQMRILRANIEDAGAKLGKVLLPYIQDLAAFLIDLVDRFDNLDPKWQKVILAAAAFAAVLGPVLIAIGFMLPAIAALGTALGFLLSPIGLLIIAIGALIGLGIYAFINDLWGVRDAVYSVIDALSVFTPMLGDLMDVFQALKEGDFAEVWDELKEAAVSFLAGLSQIIPQIIDALSGLGQAIWDALTGVDWGGVGDTILSLLGKLSDKLMEWAQEAANWASTYNWGGLFDTVKDVSATIVEKFGNLNAAIARWLVDAVSGINWDALWAFVKDATATIVEKLGNLVGALTKWIYESITGVDWTALAGAIGTALKDAVNALATAADDFGTLAVNVGEAIANAIRDQINSWSGETVKAALVAALGAITAVAGDFAALGSSIAGAVWEAIKTAAVNWDWKSLIPDWVPFAGGNSKMVGDRSGGAASAQQAAFGKNDSSQLQGIGSVFDAVAKAATAAAATIGAAAAAIAASITRMQATTTSAVASMASQVQSRFAQMQSQTTSAVSQMASQITSRISQMSSQAISAANQMRGSVSAAMSGMASQGASAMNQFASSVQSGFSRAVAAAHSGAAQIRGAVSGLNLSSQGYSIGASLGQGIASGIQAYIGTVASAAAALVSAAVTAARNAAAAHSPSRKMMQLGSDMAEGMTIGLDRGSAMVSAATAALVDIPSAMAGQTGNWGGAQQPIYISIALKSEELTDLIRNAENGGDFARSFGAQLGLYTGQP